MAVKNKYWGRPLNAPPHPYLQYEGTPLWSAAKKALADLEGNQDLRITEWHQYVVGYLREELAKQGVVTREAIRIRRRRTRATQREVGVTRRTRRRALM